MGSILFLLEMMTAGVRVSERQSSLILVSK